MTKYDKIFMVLNMNDYLMKFIEKLKKQDFIKTICLENGELSCLNVHVLIEEDFKLELQKYIDIFIVENEGLIFYKEDFLNGYFFKFEDDFMFRLIINVGNISLLNECEVIKCSTNNDIQKLSITPELLGNMINDIVFHLDIFNSTFINNDKIKALSILNETYMMVLRFLNYSYQPDNLLVDYRNIVKFLPDEEKDYCLKIERRLKTDTLHECSKMISVLLDGHVSNISISIAFHVNIDYYMHVKNKIFD